jgi:hypothetical protein
MVKTTREMTQHEKILNMCSDGQWHCQSEYWKFSHSPHKRRDDIEKHKVKCALPTLNYEFQPRDCQHGIVNSRDYLLITTFAAPEQIKEQTPKITQPSLRI